MTVFNNVSFEVERSKKIIPKYVHVFESNNINYGKRNDDIFAGFPGWKIIRWNEERIINISRNFVCEEIVKSEDINSLIRDSVVMYEILRLFGGAFVAKDFEFSRSIEEILIEDCLHLPILRGKVISKSFIVSPIHHGFWDFFLHRIRAAVIRDPINAREIEWWIGSHAISECVRLWLNDNWRANALVNEKEKNIGKLYEHGDLVIWDKGVIIARTHDIEDESSRFEEDLNRNWYALERGFNSYQI